MKENNQAIKCGVDHCKYHDQNHCTLDKIKVAKCDGQEDEQTKDATMCDSYEAE